jgi:hypothetical protein
LGLLLLRLSGGVDADDVLNEVQITQGVYYGRWEVKEEREVA